MLSANSESFSVLYGLKGWFGYGVSFSSRISQMVSEAKVASVAVSTRDVFHYHLHVVYVPVVQKEVYFRKNNKNPDLAGKLKEVITQVSHSKKWPRFKGEKGWVNSYSLLQDKFFEHMRAVGFIDFERGERGSTTEHLSVIEYKVQQESERLAELKKGISSTKKVSATLSDIESMGRRTLFGKIELTPAEWQAVSTLAKEGLTSRSVISKLKQDLTNAQHDAKVFKKRLEQPKPEPPEPAKPSPKRERDSVIIGG